LRDYRSDVVGKAELELSVCALLAQEDIADMGIESLRKWKCWDKIDQVMGVRKTDAYKLPIVKRAILRYCLQYQGKSKTAAAYVTEQTRIDAETVTEAREVLELELSAAKS